MTPSRRNSASTWPPTFASRPAREAECSLRGAPKPTSGPSKTVRGLPCRLTVCLFVIFTQRITSCSLSAVTAAWRSGSVVGLDQARLVLGWVTVSVLDSRRRHFISVCNQPPRSTQPSTVRGMVNEYQQNGSNALRPGSKGRHGVICR